jgi:hypothetical protein
MPPLQPPIEIKDGNGTTPISTGANIVQGQRFVEMQRESTGARVMDAQGVSSIAVDGDGNRKEGPLVACFEADRLGTGKHAFVGAPTVQYSRLVIATSEFET